MNFLAGDSEIHHTDDFFKLLLFGLNPGDLYDFRDQWMKVETEIRAIIAWAEAAKII